LRPSRCPEEQPEEQGSVPNVPKSQNPVRKGDLTNLKSTIRRNTF
jgi:hypothetical protein